MIYAELNTLLYIDTYYIYKERLTSRTQLLHTDARLHCHTKNLNFLDPTKISLFIHI